MSMYHRHLILPDPKDLLPVSFAHNLVPSTDSRKDGILAYFLHFNQDVFAFHLKDLLKHLDGIHFETCQCLVVGKLWCHA